MTVPVEIKESNFMMKQHALRVGVGLVFSLILGAANLAAAADLSSQQSIESFFEKIKAVKFPVTDAADYTRTSAAADVYLDVTAMGQKAMAVHWSVLSSEEQRSFSGLLEKLIAAIAYPRTQKFLNAQTVTYAEPKAIERGVEISSTMKSKETGLEIPIVYYLYDEKGQWKIYDVLLDGISMTEDLQYQFDKIISDGGPAELLKQMQIRLDRADNENGSTPSALSA
jgi:phospholipid transport system substrate-binding protein